MIPSLTKVFYLIHETFFYFFLIQFYASVKVKKGYVNRYDTFRLLKVSILTAISWPNFWSTVMQNYQNVSIYLKNPKKCGFFYNWFTKFLPLLKVSSCPLVLTASTCSLECSLASISFLKHFDARVYSSSICLYLQYSSESSIKFLIIDSLETRLGITRVFKKKS